MRRMSSEELKVKGEVEQVPDALVYEMRGGEPIYYRAYDAVMRGERSLEEVMGSGKLQWWILEVIVAFLFAHLDRKRYKVAFNEVGFRVGPGSWRSLDVAIFERDAVLAEGLDNEYVSTPPLVVIEVDTKADLRAFEGDAELYMREKTEDLLGAGVKRVIWYTTRDRRVLVAEVGQRWYLTTWDDEVEVLEGLPLNLARLLAEEGLADEASAE
ncbi:MAG: Uma2 family endonuclease [Ardenticatenia bacterium]|nr:Uma2 family endonuclease [Ardenticatenia bacterium]